MDKLLNLIGLAQKAGRLAVGEEPTGAAARQLSGLVTLNELGAFIWQQLADDCTLDTIAARITAEYDVDDATARADAENFLQSLHEIGALEHF